jgi:GTPase SAR1 family protein
MRLLDKQNNSMTKILEGYESTFYMPPIFDVYSVKEMKLEEANKTQMPTDYSGVFGFMYSIVGESSTSLSTQVKLVVIGDESSGKDLIIEKFFEESSQQTDGSTDEKFKYIEVHSHKVKVVVQTTGNHEKMLSIAPIFFK